MAIQINIPLEDVTGLDVPANSYCVLDIHFSARMFAEITMLFYKSRVEYDSGSSTFHPNNPGLEPRFLRQLTIEEYAGFTALSIHQFIQMHLETFFGPGTTTLVA